MKTPKVCLGCFSVWDKENIACPNCGWKPGKEYSEVFDWISGNIFGQRYLLGEIFLRTHNIAVWRIYDNLLGIPCFALRTVQDNAESFQSFIKRLKSARESGRDAVEILSEKIIGGKLTLLFSVQNWYIKEDALRELLVSAPEEPEPAVRNAECFSGNGQKEYALPVGTCLEGRYRIDRCVGVGGFGIIYVCEDIRLQRKVSLKEYFPAEWAERDGEYVAVKKSGMLEAYRFGMRSFLKEARITAKFIHTPHVVTIYDVMEINDTIYLVMRYIPGMSIGRELRAREYIPYTPDEMADIILPVLEALEEMHEKQIVHSDISPGNIMRSEWGEIYLIDMGAAKYTLESQQDLSAAYLKVDYAAPEQYRTAKEGVSKDEGPWTDIYAIGATMYYLLTGHKATDVISRLNGKDINLVPPKKYKVKLSKQWMELILHTMALERKDRLNSAAELRREIEKLRKK